MLLFFIPGAKALTPELAAEHALARLLSQTHYARETFDGPGGVPGLLIADGWADADRCSYRKAEQSWSPRFGFSSQVGTWNDSMPTPESLAQPHPVPGSHITLLDNHQWLVPQLRAWEDGDKIAWSIQLPRSMKQCPTTGKWLLTDVIPKFRELWAHSIEIADVIMAQLQSANSAELEAHQLFAHAIELLAVNYRVDDSVVSHLALLQPELCSDIINIALDMATLRAHLKNRLSRLASSGTNSGVGAKPSTTGKTIPTAPRSPS